jgi:tRNA threonylcarbamoyladenosine biosynthesis protein TsaE
LSTVGHHSPIVKSLVWPGEWATRLFAAQLARQSGLEQAFITLRGDLGAGKTTLVRHLLHALGVSGRIKSPTYTLVESYASARGPVWHFDFYRFNDEREWEDAGLRDIFAGPGLKIAEWPEKAGKLLPPADLEIHIHTTGETTRNVMLIAPGPRGADWVAAARDQEAPG